MKGLSIIIFLVPLLTFGQVLIGSDIDGEAADDSFGQSVSLSSDGSIVAIGGIGNDGNGDASGHVRVFENVSGVWTQIGSDIDGEAAGDTLGWSVSLSSDGSILAVGAVNSNGNGTSSGHVRVFENIAGIWIQIGTDIDGEAAVDNSGYSISLSSDGSIVAIGAVNNDGNGDGSGHVRVFENVSGVWTQIGTDIDGEAAGDSSGGSVSLSSDGSIVAIGAANNDGNGDGSGHVRIFENVSGVWTQIGTDIDGEATGDIFGRSISLSSDGSLIAVGGTGNDGNGDFSGHVRIFENVSGVWTQIGTDIDGEAAGDIFGRSISLSSDGFTVAIGGTGNDGNGIDSGHVRVYDLSAILSIESFQNDFFNVFINESNQKIEIQLHDNTTLNKANLYTIEGKYLYSKRSLVLDTNNLSSGIYVIEVETNKGISAKKIIIK